MTRQQLARAIQEVRAEELLHWVDIYPGEMIYVDAGTVHTIGPGSILVETQQNSDTTYRLYDYGRPREIHVEQGLAAMQERTRAGKVRPYGDSEMSNLIATGRFHITKCKATVDNQVALMSTNFPDWNSVEIVVGLEGNGVVEASGSSPIAFTAGEAVVVPASFENFEVHTQRGVEILDICLPPPKVDPSSGPAADRLESVSRLE